MTVYNYVKEIRADQLQDEIRKSAICIAIDHIDTVENNVDIYFKADLSVEDKAILDTIVAEHVPVIVVKPEPTTVSGNVIASLTSPQNNDKMEPWGAVRGCLDVSSNKACDIVLSNKSPDGKTFSYELQSSVVSIGIGDYVFQKYFTNRSWIVSFDVVNHTVTFNDAILDNGQGFYTSGQYTDIRVPDWATVMYLWDATLTAKYNKPNAGMNDFIEFSVVDLDGMFLSDQVCQAVFGCNAADAAPYLQASGFEMNGEYGCWTKYYKEAWIININNKLIKSPDSAPGALLPGLYLRVSFFTSEKDDTETCLFLNYTATSRDYTGV